MAEPEKDSFDRGVIEAVPGLRAFAISMCGNVDRADDLVQETVVRALANRDSFQIGTNMGAWLFTILRNHFRAERRMRWRQVQDSDGRYTERLKSLPEQHGHLDLEEFRKALAQIPPEQREALILVGGAGFSYQEAALITGSACGSVKSRVSRARAKLAELLGIDSFEDLRSDRRAFTVINGGRTD